MVNDKSYIRCNMLSIVDATFNFSTVGRRVIVPVTKTYQMRYILKLCHCSKPKINFIKNVKSYF